MITKKLLISLIYDLRKELSHSYENEIYKLSVPNGSIPVIPNIAIIYFSLNNRSRRLKLRYDIEWDNLEDKELFMEFSLTRSEFEFLKLLMI
jgi:hypothetical protein